MDFELAGAEIAAIAVELEKNGRDFYCELAKKTVSEQARIIFNYLACEEEKHIAAFEILREQLEKNPLQQNYTEEYIAYMNALAAEHAFLKQHAVGETIKEITDDQKAIEFGIQFEKDTLIFFSGMTKLVPRKDAGVIDELLRQEQEHLEQLYDLKRALLSDQPGSTAQVEQR